MYISLLVSTHVHEQQVLGLPLAGDAMNGAGAVAEQQQQQLQQQDLQLEPQDDLEVPVSMLHIQKRNI